VSARSPPEKVNAEADPAKNRSGEKGRTRVDRGGDDDQDHSRCQGNRARAHSDPRSRAAKEQLSERGRPRESNEAGAGRDHVARVEEMRSERGTEREEEPEDRPRRERCQGGEKERTANPLGMLGRCGVSRKRERSRTGSGIQ
jgi:hypothetical protein